MKIQILYFSGTGNTHFISELIKKRFSHFQVEMLTIESVLKSPELIDPKGSLGLGYPVYDLMPPKIVMKALDSLNQVSGNPAFIFSTYTSYPLDSNQHALKKLQEKGYNVLSIIDFKAPGAAAHLYVKLTNPLAKNNKIFEKDLNHTIDKFISHITCKLSQPTKPMHVKFHTFNKVHQFFSNNTYGRLFYRNLKVDSKCNQCGICVANCPDQNLLLNGSLVIKSDNHCLKCLRCVTQCPKEAINFTASKRQGNYSKDHMLNAYKNIST